MSIELALSLARSRPLIKPRGSSSISRVTSVISNGALTFIGHNSYKTHPLVARFSKNPERICIHAEIDALIQACSHQTSKLGVRRSDLSKVDLSDYKVYVARVLFDGTQALAKPCEDCQEVLDKFGITEVKWTTDVL